MKVLISVGELKRRFTAEHIIDSIDDPGEFNRAYDDCVELKLSEKEWMKLVKGSPKFLGPSGSA